MGRWNVHIFVSFQFFPVGFRERGWCESKNVGLIDTLYQPSDLKLDYFLV
jgi:hypothetical protein